MDVLETFQTTAQELIAFAQQEGVDLEPLRFDFTFQKDRRWIYLWRKNSLPGTGPAQEPPGTLHYNLQGTIGVLPTCLKESAGAFNGAWGEAGTLENIEQAVALVRAWLLDEKEVDELPRRRVRRYDI